MVLRHTGLLLALMLVGTGCVYDSYDTGPAGQEEEEMEPVSFSEDVLPIFTNNCTASGCHETGGTRPVLTEDKAYDEIMAMDLVDTDDPENSTLYRWMSSRTRSMPPSGRLDDDKVRTVLWWIRQGAKED